MAPVMTPTTNGRTAIIIRIDPHGIAILEDTDSHETFAITFDRIRGYRGEGVAELSRRGISAGKRVRFTAPNDRVDYVDVA